MKFLLPWIGLAQAMALGFSSGTLNAASRTEELGTILRGVRESSKVPALGAAVILEGKIAAIAAVGTRKDQGTEAVTAEDKFHLGSITKSMTATLAAFLIEEGKIRWDTTIGEALTDLGEEIHKDYREVTLEQLLGHQGGLPHQPPAPVWAEAWTRRGTPTEQRTRFVKSLLKAAPETPPGTKMVYSNQGYAVAGLMIETVTGESWENLMVEKLFKPLDMKSAGFGAPGSPESVDQPWAHVTTAKGITPLKPGPQSDNPASIGPGGIVHCTMEDLAKFARFHLRGHQGKEKSLKPETFRKLHTPLPNSEYAMGWIITQRPWAKELAIFHNGTNTMWFAVLWIAPNRDFAVMVATNRGGDVADQACDAVASQVIGKML